MIPHWLHILAILSLLVGALIAVGIAWDLWRHPQPMWIMNIVWPVNALFGSVLVLWGYLSFGRAAGAEEGTGHHHKSEAPFPVQVGKAASHCGSGCTLGDILAEWLAFFVPAVAVWFGWHSLFGEKMFAVWVLDFVFAFLLGIGFQYFTIQPMRHLSPGKGLVEAVKVDTLSLTAWQVGMYGFMAIAQFWLFRSLIGVPLEVPTPEFWFMMQIAMLAGFATACPVNWWLLKRGIKEPM